MEFDEFLKKALPPLGYNWKPHRRRGVRRKIHERMRQLGFCDWADYLAFLQKTSAEVKILRGLLHVTVGRFFRSPATFDFLRERIFPQLLKDLQNNTIRVLCVGSASGEEPYSVVLAWEHWFRPRHPKISLEILAMDIDPEMISRGQRAVYEGSSLKSLAEDLKSKYFELVGSRYGLREEIKHDVHWQCRDLRKDLLPAGQQIIFCSYLAFTYFSEEVQKEVLAKLAAALLPGGYLIIGKKEKLPLGFEKIFERAAPQLSVYCKIS